MSAAAREAGRTARRYGLPETSNPHLWGTKAFHLWLMGHEEGEQTERDDLVRLFRARRVDLKYLAAHIAGLEQLQVGGGKALLSGEEAISEVTEEEANVIAEYLKRGFK